MILIKLDDFIPANPTKYEVVYKDINGEDAQVEDGTNYLERVRSDVPAISVGWTNLTNTEAQALAAKAAKDIITVTYLFGEAKTCDMKVGDRSLKLKSIDDKGNTYWDISFELQG